MMLQGAAAAAGADGSHKLRIRVDCEPNQVGHPDNFSQLLELVSQKGAARENDEAGLGGSFASPVEVAIGKSFGTVDGKRRNRGKKTQVRATRDGVAGGHKRSFGDKETAASEPSIRTYWLQMEDYFRQVAQQDVRLLRPLTNLILTPEGDVSDPSLAIPPLGGHYLETWAKEDGAEADRTAEALVHQSVTRVKRKILAASPVSKKRKIPVSADAKVITTVVSPPENDDEELCHVCNGGDSDHWNEILFCDSCDVAVHQDCYGVREVPEGEWICTWCSHRSKHPRRAAPLLRKFSASEGPHADLASVQCGPPDCVLCPVRGGALKPVAEGDSNGSIRASAKLRFAHLFCCQWVPETYIHSMEAMEPIKNVEGVREERWKLLCAVCKEKHGACIQCSHGMCATAFHPLCAREAKLRMEVSSREDSEDVDLRAYCQKHSSTRGGKSIGSGTENCEFGEVFVENQSLDMNNALRESGKAVDGHVSTADEFRELKSEGRLLPSEQQECGARTAGKSIAKLLEGKDWNSVSHPVPDTVGVQQETCNHDEGTHIQVPGQVLEGGGQQSSKSSLMDKTISVVKGKNGLQQGSLSHTGSCKTVASEDHTDVIVLDSPDRDKESCMENISATKGSCDNLPGKCAIKSRDEATAVGSIAVESDTAELDVSLNEERRERGLRGDASTSQAGSDLAAPSSRDSTSIHASEEEKKESLSETQGAYRHLAGTLEEGRALPSEPMVPRRLLGSGDIVCEEQSMPQTGSKLEHMSTDLRDLGESCAGTDLGPNADSSCDVLTPEKLPLEGLVPIETRISFIDTSGKDDDSPDMQHPKSKSAAPIPEAEMDMHLVSLKTGRHPESTNQEIGIISVDGVTLHTSQNSVKGPHLEKSRPQSSQPRLRIKIGGDSASRSLNSLHEPGSKAFSEEDKAVDVPIQNLHPVSKPTLHSQWREEVCCPPHPFVLRKLKNLPGNFEIGRNAENKKVVSETEASAKDVVQLKTAPSIDQASQPGLPQQSDSNFVASAQSCSVPENNGLQSAEGHVCGDESKPGNGLILVQTQASDGDLDSLDAQWKQLNEAKRLGLFDLAPEDEIVGEILILQDKLIDCTQANTINCDTLIRKLLSLLPEEREIEQKNVQDLIIVRQFQVLAKEAKKQGRKEKRDKEAQAILAAATAAAAASPRISYMRRDNSGGLLRDDFLSQTPDASMESGGSQGFTPPTLVGSAPPILRNLKPPVPKPPKLVLTAGRPPGSRTGAHAKGTMSKVSVAKATSAKSGYYLDEAPLCSICGGGESLRPNKIVCCDRCKVAVHQECYGVGRVPLGAWHCQPCADMQRLHQNLKPPEVDATGRLGPGVQCAICPGRIGAFKRTSDGRWAHVFCAQWLPETAAGKDQTATIEGLETVLLDRFALLCSICRRQKGACLTCNFGHCHGAFHPSCARDYGLYMNVKYSSGGRVQYRAYCERHSPQQRAKAESKQRGGSDEMQVLKQLRAEFERVRLLCERIVRREKIKRELLHNMKDIGISQLRVATIAHNLQNPYDQHVDGYSLTQGPSGSARGSDDMFWAEASLPMQRVSSDKPAQGGIGQSQPDERKKHKRQRRQAEPLHSEKLMTPVEASMQNLRLPKGYAYVPVDTVPVPHQNSTDKQHPPA